MDGDESKAPTWRSPNLGQFFFGKSGRALDRAATEHRGDITRAAVSAISYFGVPGDAVSSIADAAVSIVGENAKPKK